MKTGDGLSRLLIGPFAGSAGRERSLVAPLLGMTAAAPLLGMTAAAPLLGMTAAAPLLGVTAAESSPPEWRCLSLDYFQASMGTPVLRSRNLTSHAPANRTSVATMR